MPKKKKAEVTLDERKSKITEAFGAIEDSDRLKDKKADAVAVKLDIVDLLKETIQKQLRKDFDPEANSRIIINPDRGDFEVYIVKKVVEEVEEDRIEISLADVRELDDSLEVGDEFEEGPIPLDKILSRKSIQIIKQAVQKKVRDAERSALYEECLEKIGEVVSAEVYQVHGRDTIFRYNTTKDHTVELLMPESEKMPKDNPRKVPRMRVYIKSVEREKMRVKLEDGTEIEKEREDGPMKVIVSRTDSNFLRKLFEGEVPEIYEGLIVIKSIVRVPGERAKVAVESTSSRIDPVGACVGHKGKRIQSIVKELNNENIDVISYSDESQIYIARALQPAKIDPMLVHVDHKGHKARVMLKPDQIKFAIGRNGNNIRLAEELTGFEIEIYRDITDRSTEDSDDIDIISFREDFGDDMIYQLLEAGLDTAKKIIEAGPDAVEKALTAHFRREELPELREGRPVRPPMRPRLVSEDERKHWRKMAENIYKTISEQFEADEADEDNTSKKDAGAEAAESENMTSEKSESDADVETDVEETDLARDDANDDDEEEPETDDTADDEKNAEDGDTATAEDDSEDESSQEDVKTASDEISDKADAEDDATEKVKGE
ncbi:MAG: transcription termination/antitermination protein NusA [Rhizobacter sp.]|nr:transcription termination/antitermination protein NusA [Chlorobiales bacterium]